MFDEKQLRGILEDELGIDLDDVEDDTLIFSTGVIDSFALVALITLLENATDIQVSPGDVTLENFDSIERILAYVQSKNS